jgi:type IV pilus assembly protein PilY1
MFTNKLIKGFAIFVSSTIFSLSTIQSAYAAPGNLASAPLFLSTIVEPNVFMTLDDSGSMDWGPLVKEGTAGLTTDQGLPIIDNDDRGYYTPTFSRLSTSRGYLPPAGITSAYVNGTPDADSWDELVDKFTLLVKEWDRSWVVRNHIGNRNYYNPSITYTPWVGSKADGSPMYTDADPTKALKDPNYPSGESVDLTAKHPYTSNNIRISGPDVTVTTYDYYIPTYFIWDDVEGDGQLDQTDVKTRVEIAAGTAEMQNFANWFQYYRSRINATKAIIGSTINNTDATRTGMRLFNYGHRDDVKSMSDPVNKRNMLESLYSIVIPWATTPARRALRDTGNYFDDTDSDAPILSASKGGECQQNFNILMSDGFWNGSSPYVGNTDIDGSGSYDGNQAQSNDGGNYADGISDTLADVAMRDYERDLRPDLADNVPTQTGTDEADHQHLVTYTIAFGINGTLDPTTDDPLAAGFTWPTPVKDTETTVDDMWHAAYNGRGQYLSAGNPGQLQQSLSAAISDIAERTATAAAVSINSAKLTTQSVVYLAQFNTNRWQGNLFAFKIVDLETGELSATPEWNAAGVLNSRNIVSSPRTVAQARVAYLRGDRSDEGTGNFFRERLSLLADLVNSGPVFVGAPSLNWPDTAPFPTTPGSRYSDFKKGAAASRDGMVYAGSNGGMMHGFAEADGEEKIAYIASNLFSTNQNEGMHYLTDQNYVHKYYNDLTPTVSDVYADLGGGVKWQTVLISGQRGGGRGIFALDITDPAAFSETNADKIALWEFTNSDDPDLGYTYSRPQIGMTNDGSWVAIFGNGYNDSGDGEAKLFIVDIAKGADGAWSGGDYIEITTNSGTPSDRNGLATPALADLDGNGTIDRVYAGDLRGQMWVFDLSDTNPASWGIPGTEPLFTTKGDRPITSKPALAKHPTVSDDGSNAPNVMVYFGSGQYLVDADKTDTEDNYFYGVWDKGDDDLDDSDLVQQTYDNGFSERVLTRNPVDYIGGADYGWFFELPDDGERSVTNPVVRGSLVFFNSFAPESDPCSVGGYGYRFAVNLVDGGSPEEVAVDTNLDGIIDDNDKADDGSGNTETIAAIRQEGFLPEPVFIEDIAYTAETPSKVAELPIPPTGRFGWQELLQ